MNILMCANSTLVKIDEKRVYTKNLLYFMQTNFSTIVQYKNKITINYTKQEHYDRVFLIKWLYTLYSNITNNSFPNMKELLVNRIEKPIIIEFKSIIEDEKVEIKEEIIVEEPKEIDIYQEALKILQVRKYDSKKMIRIKYKK
ncbi:MAG: hypothetical protein U9P72_08855, partial [Campylobacterota bacterium]|nr:hypothetical protein [Campylobacterota bacterium]